MKTNKKILNKETRQSKRFVRVMNKDGEFKIVLKLFVYQDDDGFQESYYFQPCFTLNSAGNKIVRKDIVWEKNDVIGLNTAGFIVTDKDDFEKYCKECFEAFRSSLLLNPFSTQQEPEYTDKEICDLEFNFGYEKE